MLQRFSIEVPLAWSQLFHQKIRLAVATTGVCFANILMFTQLGIQATLSQGTTRLHESIAGDLLLISSFSPSLEFQLSFPRAYLIQADAVEGVASARPLYISSTNWVNPQELSQHHSLAKTDKTTETEGDSFGNQVRIIAFNPVQPVLNLPEVNQQIQKLNSPDTVLFDRLSQPSLGAIPELFGKQPEVTTIMGNRRTYVKGLFSMGSTLDLQGNAIVSDLSYAQNYAQNGQNSLDSVTIGVLSVQPGATITTVQKRLRNSLPKEISVYTHEEFIQQERQYQASKPEGIVLTFGTIVGFVVGVIIVYQVLYVDVSEHLSEYATLKAMGYSDRSLLQVVLQEAIILAVLGFLPSLIASVGIYQLLAILTRIPLTMQLSVVVKIFFFTLIMCSLSGVITFGKLLSADPADVF
jgi:putative ABC transport system permease protein